MRRVFILASTLLAFSSFVGPAAAASPWTSGAPLPTARAQMVVTVDKSGAIHMFGGYSIGGTDSVDNHDVLQSDGGWTPSTAVPVALRGAAGATGSDGTLYLVGGYVPSASAEVNSLYAFGSDAGWTQLTDAPANIGWETAADIGADGKLYVFGGEGDQIADGGTNLGSGNGNTQIYNPTTQTWSAGAPMPGRRLQHQALRGSDGRFYVIGGQDENNVPQSTVLVYSPTTNTWATGPELAFPPDADAGVDAGDAGADADADAGAPTTVPVLINSFAAAATPDRGFFVVAGGSTEYGNDDGPFFDTVFIFDVAAQRWTRYATPLPLGRRDLAAAFQNCTLSVLGGSNGTALDNLDVNASLPLGPDTDSDGIPDTCDPDDDNDGTPDTTDCAPKDPAIHPGATEVCNGKDDNCDGTTDENGSALCAANTDGPVCVADTPAHCGCSADTDCRSGTQLCSPSAHVCVAICDGGPCPVDGGTDSGLGDAAINVNDASTSDSDAAGNGDTSSGGGGCGCELVSSESSGGFAALSGLGFVAAIARRVRRRTRTRSAGKHG